MAAVGADTAAAYGYDGEGIGIAIIDSGIFEHDDLKISKKSKVVYRESFIPGRSKADPFGHGTHVAGIIAGQGAAASTAETFRDEFQGRHEFSTSWAPPFRRRSWPPSSAASCPQAPDLAILASP